MLCPHCGVAYSANWKQCSGAYGADGVWFVRVAACPECKKSTVRLAKARVEQETTRTPQGTAGRSKFVEEWDKQIYPSTSLRKPTPSEVPAEIAADYEEACKVLAQSAKASAALARRCLQAILREHGYQQWDLVKQIDAVLGERDPAKALPTGLRETIDAVRHFGNFAAHHITDQTTLQIIDVEDGEAEWCLEIIEEAFDHYYVKPAQARARKDALNAKLKAAGRAPAK